MIGIRVSRAVIAEMEKRNGEVNEMRVVFFFFCLINTNEKCVWRELE
jgi:hypothetical protein